MALVLPMAGVGWSFPTGDKERSDFIFPACFLPFCYDWQQQEHLKCLPACLPFSSGVCLCLPLGTLAWTRSVLHSFPVRANVLVAQSQTSGKDKEILSGLSQSSGSKEMLAPKVVFAKASAVVWLERAQPLQQRSFSVCLQATGQRNNCPFCLRSEYALT